MATHRSNSTHSVHWMSGHNSNTLTLSYLDRGPQQVTLSLSQVTIKKREEAVLRDEKIHRCGFFARSRVYAAPVEITITDVTGVPAKLLAETNEGVLKTEVICTSYINSYAPCPTTEENN